jgi:hypothetical protein
MRASILLLGHPFARRSSVWVSQAWGSTAFIFAVCSSVATVAPVLPPPSLPAKRLFFLMIAWGLIARSTCCRARRGRPSASARRRRGARWHTEVPHRRVAIFGRKKSATSEMNLDCILEYRDVNLSGIAVLGDSSLTGCAAGRGWQESSTSIRNPWG